MVRLSEVTEQSGSSNPKEAVRAAWALGDYHRFATALVWSLGEVLVGAVGNLRGKRVLDVAAGTGNTAIRAAEAGAVVVASDLTPENFKAGRREAASRGVEIDWVEADAEALPFEAEQFDVVTSSVGAIFAPNHQAVADEMLRVCRPGGTIGMINFTPQGTAADFFDVFTPYMPPPPPGAQPPVLWGSEQHVSELFGDRVSSLQLTRDRYIERAASPRDYCEFIKETFGPVAAIFAGLQEADPDQAAQLDREFLQFAEKANAAADGSTAEYPYDYLLVIAQKA